ncbi:hypothetical protein [Streptodolium elevatio]
MSSSEDTAADSTGRPAGDPAPDRRGATPMKIAFALRESGAEIPLPEAVVEVDTGSYPTLLNQAQESGFVPAFGEPPATSAEVQLRSGQFTSLLLLGERQIWEMDPPAPVASAWTDAAAHHGIAIVSVVPPGTWPSDITGLPPAEAAARFAHSLEQARDAHHLLHGTARVVHT